MPNLMSHAYQVLGTTYPHTHSADTQWEPTVTKHLLCGAYFVGVKEVR